MNNTQQLMKISSLLAEKNNQKLAIIALSGLCIVGGILTIAYYRQAQNLASTNLILNSTIVAKDQVITEETNRKLYFISQINILNKTVAELSSKLKEETEKNNQPAA